MEYKICRADELTHHGIKGMKWGIRRYQNKDGTLTPAGEKRLKTEREALKKEEQIVKNHKKTKAKFDKLEAKRKALEEEKKSLSKDPNKPVKKTMKDMSNEELKAAVTRAQQEWQYLDYTKKINDIKAQERQRMSPGKKFFIAALHKMADEPIANATKGALEKNLKEAMGIGKNNNNQQKQSGGNKKKNKSGSNKKKDDYDMKDISDALKEIINEERSDIKEIATFVDNISKIRLED